MPTTAIMSMVDERPADSLLNFCSLNFKPPDSIDNPIRSSTLIMIEPVMDALTSSTSPACKAKIAMKNSTALPNVAFMRAAIVVETRVAMMVLDSAIK